MSTIPLLTTPDMTLSWIFYLLLGLLLVTITVGALGGRTAAGRQASSARRAARKPAPTARKGAPDKRPAK
jgi:hypothetical protein